ncbi:MAG: COX15/CtaA family protein [Deltaproteobacteria bacterium]|nr:COX15/CtaA family protein [Deltaproteobacteria bacterium]
MNAKRISATQWLAIGFSVLTGVTFCLIVLGASVRANDAGLACPDWPLCFGELIPTINVKVAFEFGHRVLAGLVSTGLVILSIFAWRQKPLRRLLTPRLVWVWILLATQVIFGGLTVLLRLAPWTVSAHLILGNAFCLTLLWIARDIFEAGSEPKRRPSLGIGVRVLACCVAGCLLLQLVLGGFVSSYYAGLACTTFPTCNGDVIAPTFTGVVGLHVLHRLNGFLLLSGYALLVWRLRGQGSLGRLASMGFALVIVQIGLGIADVLLKIPVEITALHTATAAIIVLTTATLMREVVMSKSELRNLSTNARMVEVR